MQLEDVLSWQCGHPQVRSMQTASASKEAGEASQDLQLDGRSNLEAHVDRLSAFSDEEDEAELHNLYMVRPRRTLHAGSLQPVDETALHAARVLHRGCARDVEETLLKGWKVSGGELQRSRTGLDRRRSDGAALRRMRTETATCGIWPSRRRGRL